MAWLSSGLRQTKRICERKRGREKRGKEKGWWRRGSQRNSMSFKIPRQCQTAHTKINLVCVESVCMGVHACVYTGLCSWASACDWQLYSNALWLSGSWLLGQYLWGYTEKTSCSQLQGCDGLNMLCSKAESRWAHGSFTNPSEKVCVWSLPQ